VKESYLVNHAGLMRCCLQSLDDAMLQAERLPVPGTIIKCQYCGDPYGIVLGPDQTWRWAAPELNPEPDPWR